MLGASLVAQMLKNLPAMRETQVQLLDQEDPLEKGMTTHSSILAWKIPRTEEPGSWDHKESDTTERLTASPWCLGINAQLKLWGEEYSHSEQNIS